MKDGVKSQLISFHPIQLKSNIHTFANLQIPTFSNSLLSKTSFSYLIAKKLRSKQGSNFSALITKIAVGSVALGLTVMIITSIIFNGFRHTIQEKIFSLSAHLKVSKFDLQNSYEEMPISTNASVYAHPEDFPEIQHIQSFARKAGILKTEEELSGVMLKGIGSDFDSARFHSNMKAGRFPKLDGENYSREIVVSQKIANKLRLKVGDRANIFFVQDPPKHRPITVVGIYETGIEDFDELMVLSDLRMIQKINNWPDTLVGGFEIFIPDFEQLDQAHDELYRNMNFSLTVDKVTNEFRHLFDWFLMIRANASFLLVIILIIAYLNIISILLIMIVERIHMIGTLKALGARRLANPEDFLVEYAPPHWLGFTYWELCRIRIRFSSIRIQIHSTRSRKLLYGYRSRTFRLGLNCSFQSDYFDLGSLNCPTSYFSGKIDTTRKSH